MATGLIDIIKRTALEAFANEQPCDLRYGTVINNNPLQIRITNLLVIPSAVLVIPEHLTNRNVNITIDGEEKTMTVQNELKVGDKVALLRKQGGQSYFILDRI